MHRLKLLRLAASALALTSLTAAAVHPTKHAERAEKALAGGKLDAAIAGAEAAVAASPRDADFRMLLGRVYLQAGRYQSAAATFADVLALDASRGAAALSLALTRIGLGDKDAARAVLEAHGDKIAAGDRGLALALLGYPATGVALLEAEVRNGGADAKVRQNLALAYGLAGRWPEAQLMASYDLDPATLAQRIMEWSRFAREAQVSAQVAALLGVAPAADPGQPVQLALQAAAPNVRLAEAAPPPPMKMAEAAPLAAEPAAPPMGVQFAVRTEVAQPVSARVTPAARQPIKAVRPQEPAFARPTGGRFVVQLGAFDNATLAHTAWERMAARSAQLRGVSPSTATVIRGAATLHRLSVSGFGTRSTAVSFCEQLRARGGQCFVRQAAGDAPLLWARRGGSTRLAAR